MSIYRPLVSTVLSAANEEKPGERLGERQGWREMGGRGEDSHPLLALD